MNYYIHKDKMHAGINLARISFDYRDIHKEITIVASTDKEGVSIDSDEFFQNRKILSAFRLYEDFRLRRVSTAQWCTQTLEIIESLEDDQKNENFILLLKAF